MLRSTLSVALATLLAVPTTAAGNCSSSCPATTLHLVDPPYNNYFYSDCHVDAQAVITSPLPDSNLSIIGPRLVVAWPAGNSGLCTFFQPQDAKNGSPAIELVNSTLGLPLGPVYNTRNSSHDIPISGVQGVLSFNNSAELSLAILGSVRTIRDFVEGPSILNPTVQKAVKIAKFQQHGAQISRLWLDNVTITTFTLVPWKNNDGRIHVGDSSIKFGAGFYHFSASFNYPQLKQLTPKEILNDQSQSIIKSDPGQVNALSFFSYSEKLLAGGWRFLTYFGRDSMISALLLQPILRTGAGSAIEAVLGAALERINKTDGTVSHEETIGDYATLLNLEKGINSSAAGFTYQMVDVDYYLPILMAKYFQASSDRIRPLLDTKAGLINEANKDLTWGDLGYRLSQKIMNRTAAFEQEQTVANLIHINDGENVGQWRDSNRGLGNGRIPFDVNCALVPAALSAISSLATIPGVFPDDGMAKDWASQAARRAKVWEDKTLAFFEHSTSTGDAVSLIEDYTTKNTFYRGPSNADTVNLYSSNGSIVDYGLSIKNDQTPDIVKVTHTDTAFRNVFLNTTNDEQLSKFINASANAILRPFPAGLVTGVGAVVANPALSNDNQLIANLTNSAYHGTVVWGWQLALVARGFELQLSRCQSETIPAFCKDDSVHGTLKKAYNRLWDVIEQNKQTLQSEVWSWTYTGNGTQAGYKQVPLGVLPPPPGEGGGTESDIRQLWSLVFLAISRNANYK